MAQREKVASGPIVSGEFGVYTRSYPKAIGIVKNDARPCYDELICALKARRVKSILEFDFDRLKDRSFKNQLFAAGFNVRRVMHKFEGDGVSLGAVRKAGYKTVADFFADRRNLPYAILFDDDYFAAYVLKALVGKRPHLPRLPLCFFPGESL